MPSDFFLDTTLKEPYMYNEENKVICFGDHIDSEILHGRVVVVDKFGIYLFRYKDNQRHGEALCIWNCGLKGKMEFKKGMFYSGTT
jgi:hypothetical protein